MGGNHYNREIIVTLLKIMDTCVILLCYNVTS